MIIAHTSDLHLGKNLNGFSLIEDQEYILKELILRLKENKVEVLIVAGDLYDKYQPSIEAQNLFDWFLNELDKLKIKTIITSGNHDSADRLAFAKDFFKKNNIFICTKYDGKVEHVDIENVRFFMLPFIKPVHVKKYFEEEIVTYEDAFRAVLSKEELDNNKINILIAHQFVTKLNTAQKSDSEIFQVGTLDNIDYSVFIKFDYVALGHLHRPQYIGEKYIRYSGSILKYSFSEYKDKKQIVILDTKDMSQKYVCLKPLRDMKIIESNLKDIFELYEKSNDYYKVILTDRYKGIDVVSKLRKIFPNLMKLEYKLKENKKMDIVEKKEKKPLELIKDFYEFQKGEKMTDEILEILNEELGGSNI